MWYSTLKLPSLIEFHSLPTCQVFALFFVAFLLPSQPLGIKHLICTINTCYTVERAHPVYDKGVFFGVFVFGDRVTHATI